MPLVSVIVPNYNHAKYLQLRLDSIFSQTFQDFEVILLDDASSDNSLDILKKYADKPNVTHLIINEKNGGNPFKQWEKGINLSKGRYIWIAESDDSCDPNLLKTLVSNLEADNTIGLAYSQSKSINNENEFFNSWEEHTKDIDQYKWKENFKEDGFKFVSKYMILKNAIPNASAAVWRKSILELEVFDQVNKYLLHGDRLFWSNILLRSNLFFCANILNYFRIHDLTLRSFTKGWISFEENLNYLSWAKKNGIKIENTLNLRKQIIITAKESTKTNNFFLLVRIIIKLSYLNLLNDEILRSLNTRITGYPNKILIRSILWLI